MKVIRLLFISVLFLTGAQPGLVRAATEKDEVVSRMKRQSVVSTNVASVGYNQHLHVLEIEFSRGAIYRFLDVPRSVYRELMETSSKGHFINENLRGHYRFVHVRGPGRAISNHAITAK